MNNSNLKKRRPYNGFEDAPAPPESRDLSFPASASLATHHYFSSHELQILEQAAMVLNCPTHNLFQLDRRRTSHLQHIPSSPAPHSIDPNKRPRLSTDVSTMSSPEKQSPSGQPVVDASRRSGETGGGLGLRIDGSNLVNFLSNFNVCSPCTTCEPPAYAGIPASSSYNYAPIRPYLDQKPSPTHGLPGSLPHDQSNPFASDDSVVTPSMMPNYPPLQPNRPMTMQPTTSGEGMVYPDSLQNQKYLHGPDTQDGSPTSANSHGIGQPFHHMRLENPKKVREQYGVVNNSTTSMPEKTHVSHTSRHLDIVLSNQRPPPARRGPFRSNDDREKTAETRRIGSCIRCRMQRIRCETNPSDKQGQCLTCQKVSNVKVWRMPCLRYKITDVKLFKPGQVKGHEWTRRWAEGIADDISQWASLETKNVKVTEGYTDQPVQLRVRQFIPQEGDVLYRSWVTSDGVRKRVHIPAYAIVDLEEAKSAYSSYISRGVFECCKKILSGKEKMLMATYVAAIRATRDPDTDEKERELLKKALQLWMAVRLTTKSTIIVGQETLGMPPDIMDDTSPLHGSIPLPPVMGAQIELVLIHQIQSTLRREMLENLQAMTQANKHQTWFTTYLITFILLHNVSLLCQHDAAYAQKHGFKTQFAREDMVREYQMGANILLAYFHYCNKGIYPFSAECKDQDLTTLAELDDTKTNFIKGTRVHVAKHKRSWQKMRESHDYLNDFYYTSQLFEENWQPQSTI
ncbi:hypothetical protein F5Y15DRAFT_358607 [Xylariaceae sp. FL0016]|nr:hypothetical protein F5Y15DRAFT_358607 [Xylariaceae sp. FL0016]